MQSSSTGADPVSCAQLSEGAFWVVQHVVPLVWSCQVRSGCGGQFQRSTGGPSTGAQAAMQPHMLHPRHEHTATLSRCCALQLLCTMSWLRRGSVVLRCGLVCCDPVLPCDIACLSNFVRITRVGCRGARVAVGPTWPQAAGAAGRQAQARCAQARCVPQPQPRSARPAWSTLHDQIKCELTIAAGDACCSREESRCCTLR